MEEKQDMKTTLMCLYIYYDFFLCDLYKIIIWKYFKKKLLVNIKTTYVVIMET